MKGNMYTDSILDHCKHPRNKGQLQNADFSGSESNPLCGDKIQIALKVSNGLVEEVLFDGEGCAISIAAASMLTEAIKGRRLEEVRRLRPNDILLLLDTDLARPRVECAVLPLNALQNGFHG
jgi:nitrogen fixation protein NifU and related proteins